MTKTRWRGSLNSFSHHIAPEKEEQMRWMKIGKQPETLQIHRRIWDTALRPNRMLFKACLLAQYPERGILWHTEWQLIRKIEEQVKKILKIMQNINHGNKERNLRKKAEAIHLIEDFQKQYESLYSLYENLKEQVKKKVGSGGDDNTSSTSDSDSESHHSQSESKGRSNTDASKVSDSDYQESEASDSEDTTILKDKLTCSSEVKQVINPEPETTFTNPPELREVFKDLGIQGEEESEKTSQMLGRIKDLEGQVDALKIEVSNLCTKKTQLEEQVEWRLNEATQTKEEISRLEAQILEMMATSKEKECQYDSLGKQLADNEQHYSSRISDLVAQVDDMQHELNTLKQQKGELEERLLEEIKKWSSQVNSLQKEVENVNEQKDELKLKLEKKSKETEEYLLQIQALRNELSLNGQQKGELEERLLEEIKQWSSQVNSLQKEVENVNEQKDELKLKLEKKSKETEEYLLQIQALRNELSLNEQQKNGELEERLSKKIKQWSSQVNSLQKEVENVNEQKDELKLKLEKKSKETEEYLLQIQALRNELSLNEQQKNELELEIKSLKKTENESSQPNFEKEKLLEKVSELETSLSQREDELSIEQRKSKDSQTIASVKIKSLADGVEHIKSKMESLQNEKECLQVELEALQNEQKELKLELDRERENSSQLEKISKTNFQLVERKVDELAEEFRKQYEDQFRILSRRIKVAEQLQVESKEWYQKTRETYEQETKEHKEVEERTEGDLKNVKDLTVVANELLTLVDSQALKFVECTGNLVNRISKASCELNFAKQWAMRKNKALSQVRDDMDCLVSQLDDREGEMLVYREKVWKSENKVRELEKTIKDQEDGMLVLNEEKREAIRQLCVWIDYHRGRSDFYKKMLSEMSTGKRRAP